MKKYQTEKRAIIPAILTKTNNTFEPKVASIELKLTNDEANINYTIYNNSLNR